MYKELSNLPDYTPSYITNHLKEYLDHRDDGEYGAFLFKHVLALINFARTRQNITIEQAVELKNIIMKMRPARKMKS